MLPSFRDKNGTLTTPSSRWRLPRLSFRALSLVLICVIVFLLLSGGERNVFIENDWSRFRHHPPSPGFMPDPEFRPGSGAGRGRDSESVWNQRAQKVKEAMKHAWTGYETYAWAKDELRPLSGKGEFVFNNWAVTLIDSLDTLLIMGMMDEYEKAVSVVADLKFEMPKHEHAPFFETVIRYLGGLLSAYALADRLQHPSAPILLVHADLLGHGLLPAFNSTSGIPVYGVNPQFGTNQGHPWASGSLLAEIGSCQMEYKYLAHLTGRAEYFEATDKVIDVMRQNRRKDGLYPTFWDPDTGKPINSQVTLGALADSAYEYLLKGYLLSSKSEHKLKEMYVTAMNSAIDNLMYITPTRHLLYVTDSTNGQPTGKMEHLACFVPGMLALGVKALKEPDLELDGLDRFPDPLAGDGGWSPWSGFKGVRFGKEELQRNDKVLLPRAPVDQGSSTYLTKEDAQMHLWAAEGLSHTCARLYADHPVGLGPEEAIANRWPTSDDGSQRSHEPGRWKSVLKKWKVDKANGGGSGSTPGGRPEGVWRSTDPEDSLGLKDHVEGESRDYTVSHRSYLLRPETVETFFVMWKTTHDPVWRERGWKAFQGIEQLTKTKYGYASIRNVKAKNSATADQMDSMPSYFTAETLKYLYLLFSEEDIIPLDEWVFTTEAHPLPIFEWHDWEKKRYKL